MHLCVDLHGWYYYHWKWFSYISKMISLSIRSYHSRILAFSIIFLELRFDILKMEESYSCMRNISLIFWKKLRWLQQRLFQHLRSMVWDSQLIKVNLFRILRFIENMILSLDQRSPIVWIKCLHLCTIHWTLIGKLLNKYFNILTTLFIMAFIFPNRHICF